MVVVSFVTVGNIQSQKTVIGQLRNMVLDDAPESDLIYRNIFSILAKTSRKNGIKEALLCTEEGIQYTFKQMLSEVSSLECL